MKNSIYYDITGGKTVSVTYKDTGYNSYSGTVNIPATVVNNGTTYTVTEIGQYAFRTCSGLTNVVIPNTITTIDFDAFYACTALTSIKVASGNTAYDSRNNCNAIIETATNTLIAGCNASSIPTTVTAIGNSAFKGCYDLTDTQLHDNITSIGRSAYESCTGLTSLRIPAKVNSIDATAFIGCDNIASITVDNRNTTYDSRRNCNAIIETASSKLVRGCMNTIIPDGIVTIGEYAFRNYMTMTHIHIPASVTSIESEGFMYTYALETIICEAMTPPAINGSSFFEKNYQHSKLYVPRDAINAYANAEYWKEFVDIRAIEDLVRGDVDDDEQLSTNDATLLIDYLITGNAPGVNLYNADFNNDDAVSIDDLSMFIDYLITGH